MFWFRKKKVVVNCFVSEEYSFVNEFAPIAPAYKFYPEWWKKLEKEKYDLSNVQPEQNMRSCVGFINNFKSGFIMPNWVDIALNIRPDNFRFTSSDQKVSIVVHDNKQASGFYENYWFLKLNSPWQIQSEKKDLKFAYLPCMWNSTEPTPYITPTGIVDFGYNHATNIFLLTEKKKQDIFIHFRQPLVHYLPITEDKIDLRTEVISKSEYTKLHNKGNHFSFLRKGVNQRLIGQGKCPIKTMLKK